MRLLQKVCAVVIGKIGSNSQRRLLFGGRASESHRDVLIQFGGRLSEWDRWRVDALNIQPHDCGIMSYVGRGF